MGNLDIGNTELGDMTNVEAFAIPAMNTDGISNEDETFWQNTKWSQQWGYFNKVADLKSAILLKAIWNVGKGYNCDTRTKVILDHISGWGKDSFDDILFNLRVVSIIGGDAFAEIIRGDDKEETIINLKPLDPGSIRIVVDKKGIIKRYEQVNKVSGLLIKFEPDRILHLSNNRLADQIHGISDIDALEDVILADGENFVDMQKIMHRGAKPMIMFKLGTDKTATITSFITKMDQATNKGENIYIPDDANTVEYEVVQVNVPAMILDWRNELRNKFYRSIGLPQIVPGGGGQSSESESKVIYMAFEQIVEKEQRTIELQLWNQLQIKIDLNSPASMQPTLQQDTMKDGNMLPQPSDIIAGVGR